MSLPVDNTKILSLKDFCDSGRDEALRAMAGELVRTEAISSVWHLGYQKTRIA